MKKLILLSTSVMLPSACNKNMDKISSSKSSTPEGETMNAHSCMAVMYNDENVPSNGSSLVGETTHFWAKSKDGAPTVIRVSILEGGKNTATPLIRKKIEEYAKVWEKYANLQFKFVGPKDPAEIRVGTVQGLGSWSYVGTVCAGIPKNESTMNYGWFNDWTSETEFSRVITHEFGHAIGFGHEQSHPEISLQWNKPAVYEYYAKTNGWSKQSVDFNVFYKYPASETTYSRYDPTSIMHYPVPANFTTNGVGVGWNTELSEMDKTFVGKIYPFSKGGKSNDNTSANENNSEKILYTINLPSIIAYNNEIPQKVEIKLNKADEVVINKMLPGLPLDSKAKDQYTIRDASSSNAFYNFSSETIFLEDATPTNLKGGSIRIFKNGEIIYSQE